MRVQTMTGKATVDTHNGTEPMSPASKATTPSLSLPILLPILLCDAVPLPFIIAELELMSEQGIDVQHYLSKLSFRDEGASLL